MEEKVVGLGFYNENGIVFQDENKHIIENVKRVISTRRGERIGNLSFGSDVMKFLFMPEISIDDVINEIVNSLKRCEPRVEVIECTLNNKNNDIVTIDLLLRVRKTNNILKANIEV